MVYLPPISVANPLVLENGIPIPPISIANPGIYTEGKGGGGGGGGNPPKNQPPQTKLKKPRRAQLNHVIFPVFDFFLKLSYEISLPNENSYYVSISVTIHIYIDKLCVLHRNTGR